MQNPEASIETEPSESPGNKGWLWEFVIPCVMLAIIASGLTLYLHAKVPERLSEERFYDAHFGADIPRGFWGLTSRWTRFGGNTKHPLVGFLVIPTYALQVAGLSAWRAASLMLAANNALLAILVFLLGRKLCRDTLSSLAITGLLLSSGASIFWLPIPETYAFGATSVLLPLTVFLFSPSKNTYWYQIVTHVAALGITVTNWSSALATSFSLNGWRRTIPLAIHAFGVLYLLTIIQPMVVPVSTFINANEILHQNDRYSNRLGVSRTLGHFFLTANSPQTAICSKMPPNDFKPLDWPYFDFRKNSDEIIATVAPPSRPIRLIQNGIWIVLISAGLVYYLVCDRRNRLLMAIYLALIAQLMIALKYGDETFIYTLHWTPLFALTLAGPMSSRFRPALIGLVVLLAIGNAWTNISMYSDTMAVLESSVDEIIEQSGAFEPSTSPIRTGLSTTPEA